MVAVVEKGRATELQYKRSGGVRRRSSLEKVCKENSTCGCIRDFSSHSIISQLDCIHLLTEMTQFLLDNIVLLLVIFIAAAGLLLPVLNSRRYGPEVPAQAAVRLINQKQAQLIDVRKPADFRRGHISGALNLPADSIQNRLDCLDRNRPIVLVDNMGASSRTCARLLRGVGFNDVYVLEGGIVSWTKENLPLE